MTPTSPAVLRPAQPSDAPQLTTMLASANADTVGMLSLPHDEKSAHEACQTTASTIGDLEARSFSLGKGQYRRVLFVLVEQSGPQEQIIGLTGVTFKGTYPNLAIHIATDRHGSGLVMQSTVQPWSRTELDSTVLTPSARGGRRGTTLSRGRFMFLHLVRHQVPRTVASHIRGRFDDDGTSPFWPHLRDHVGSKWRTSIDAETALASNPERLANLADHTVPLTAGVLESLGPVNSSSRPAFNLLLAEGLSPNGMYDPIDGGPSIEGQLSRTVTYKSRVHGRARLAKSGDHLVDALVATSSVSRFRATRAQVDLSNDGWIGLDEDVAEHLMVDDRAVLTASPLA